MKTQHFCLKSLTILLDCYDYCHKNPVLLQSGRTLRCVFMSVGVTGNSCLPPKHLHRLYCSVGTDTAAQHQSACIVGNGAALQVVVGLGHGR